MERNHLVHLLCSGYATFSGELSPRIPKTSDLLYSGYAAIRSKPNKVASLGKTPYNIRLCFLCTCNPPVLSRRVSGTVG